MMLKDTGLLLAISVLLTASGCASLLDGSSQVVSFHSDPKRAKVFINGVQVGVTPVSTQVKRSNDAIVVFKKEGYEDEQIALQTKLNTYFWGNILSGGFSGSTTDYATGAAVEYAPKTYHISLEPIKTSDADRKRFSYQKRVRHFILVNYSNLASDLAKGQGEYLVSLYALLGINALQPHDTVGRLRQLAMRYEDIPAFADEVIAQFLKT
jgi:hypothetical protein